MMPLMHFRPVDHILQPAAADIDIGVNIHAPHRIDQRLDRHYRRIGPQQQYDRRKFDGLVDNDLHDMRPRPCQPVHLLVRMMRLMRPPQQLAAMLRPVEPVDIEIMDHQEQQYLQRHRPMIQPAHRFQMPAPPHRLDQIIEDEDLQEIALDERIPDQVHPEPIPEDRHALGIRILPLQPDKDEYAQYQQTGSIINDRSHTIYKACTLLSRFLAPNSLSYTCFMPSPIDCSTSLMSLTSFCMPCGSTEA